MTLNFIETVENIFCCLLFCRFDYLRIENDKDENFGTYCGQRSGHDVHVTGKHAVISFHSDERVGKRGYDILFLYVLLSKYIEDLPLLCYFQSRSNDFG